MVCNKVSSLESHAAVSWSITLLGSSRTYEPITRPNLKLTNTPREGVASGKHYLICGVQGDFTKSLIDDPPTTIWTRELKVGTGIHSLTIKMSILRGCGQFAGVSNTSALYKRGIRVCTGTGLGAALSTCLQVCCYGTRLLGCTFTQ